MMMEYALRSCKGFDTVLTLRMAKGAQRSKQTPVEEITCAYLRGLVPFSNVPPGNTVTFVV